MMDDPSFGMMLAVANAGCLILSFDVVIGLMLKSIDIFASAFFFSLSSSKEKIPKNHKANV
jgi:hypothetical protein